MKLPKLLFVILALCAHVMLVHAQGMTAIISYCGIENTLGCGCDAGTRVPFNDGENSWCVFWDRNLNGPDVNDELVPTGDQQGEANYDCLTFNGEELCGIAGNIYGDPAFYIQNPHETDPPVYYLKASGESCCWVSDTFRLVLGLQDVVLVDGDFECLSTPCPIGAVPAPVTNVSVSVDQFCLEARVSWQHDGNNVSGFRLTVYDEQTDEWVFHSQVGDTFRNHRIPLCRDGEFQIGVRAINGSQTSDRVPGVGSTFLRRFDPVQPIQLSGLDVTLNLTKPPQGDLCEARLYFDLFSGGAFVQRLCEVTSPDMLQVLQVQCTLPGNLPNENCMIVMLDSAAAPTFNGCGLSDTVYFVCPAVSSDDHPTLVREFSLMQNYPNPFNPNTTIEFTVPADGSVELSVFNLNGQEVATLVNGNIGAGSHRVDWNGAAAATGVYFYRLQMGNQVITRKMLLLK